MPKPAQSYHGRINLNLLYPQGISQKIYLKFLKWLIAYGRFIVVVVEIIVLACFVYRFKLDADLNDLKEKINNQVPYLESLETDEAIIKRTQNKLSTIRKSYTTSNLWKNTLDKIANLTPLSTKLTSLSLASDPTKSSLDLKITAQTSSNIEIASFLVNLKNTVGFTAINLTSISFDQGQITFSISGETK